MYGMENMVTGHQSFLAFEFEFAFSFSFDVRNRRRQRRPAHWELLRLR